VRTLLCSDRSSFIAEYLLVKESTNSSLQPEMELAFLLNILSVGNNGIGWLLEAIAARWGQEYSVSKFGKADPRARGWENSLDYTLSLLLQKNTPLISALPNGGDH